MIHYPELKHILALHDALIERYGGTKGIRDKGLLESAISQPMQAVFGEEIFPDIPSKAAAYAYYISENQPFLDGNKRTATASALTFLRLNGFDLKLKKNEREKIVYDTIMKVANKELSREQLTEWFRKNTRRKRRQS